MASNQPCFYYDHGMARHVCARGCFFASYEPARRLMALKLACLVSSGEFVEESGGSERGSRGGERLVGWSAFWSPRDSGKGDVCFVAPDGTICTSTKAALRKAGMHEKVVSAKDVDALARDANDEHVNACIADIANMASTTTHDWSEGSSPFGLLEELYAHDASPWRLLASCILLNQTRRRICLDAVATQLFRRFPTPLALKVAASRNEIDVLALLTTLLRPLGMHRKRAKTLIALASALESKMWAVDTSPTPILWRDRLAALKSLPGVGHYAVEAYTLFIERRIDEVHGKSDHALRWYRAWRRHCDLCTE